jgi:cysteine desulfurase
MMPVYLDYASTPIDPVVTTSVRPPLHKAFGNPSSEHWAGRPAKTARDRARG